MESSVATNQQNTIRMSALYAYPNNHSTITLEEIQDLQPDIQVDFYYWHDFPAFRKDNNWRVPQNATRLKLTRPFHLFSTIRKIMHGSDVVYFQSFSTPRVMMPLLLLLFLFSNRPKRIIVASEGLKKKPGAMRRAVLRTLFNSPRITHLGIGADSSQDFYDAGFSRWQYRKYNFNERYDAASPKKPSTSSQLRLLSVGQLIDRKDYARLLRILGKSRYRHRVSLQIAGGGDQLEQLQKLCERFQLVDQVEFLGHCDHEILERLFRDADAFILLSKYDGWGVVINQAIQHGLPCVLSDRVRAGQDYLVDHRENGFICHSDEEVASAIECLLENQATRQKMSAASFEKSKLWNLEVSSLRLAKFLRTPEVTFQDGPLSAGTVKKFD